MSVSFLMGLCLIGVVWQAHLRELHGEMGMSVNLLASRSFGFVLFLESVNFSFPISV